MDAHVTRARTVDAPEKGQYLTFMLDKEVFAIGILTVKEIIGYGGITAVPLMPSAIRGVINLRGSVVPVMDLAARFEREPAASTRRTCIVIVEVDREDEKQVIGVIVDAVNAVLDIPADEIEPPPAFGARLRGDFIQGMGKIDGRFVVLLDVPRVLSLDTEIARSTPARDAHWETAPAVTTLAE